MAEDQQSGLTGPAVRPEEYAVRIAADHHLAAQFCQYRSLGDTPDAEQLALDEARAILTLCGSVPVTAEATHRLVGDSMRSIRQVAARSEARGDAVQVAWCRMLHDTLAAVG
jgi:hypothetical protein